MIAGGWAAGFGLAAAGTWGAADFSGGVAAKRAPPALVVLLAHISSLALLILVDLVMIRRGLMHHGLLWPRSMTDASLKPGLLGHDLTWFRGGDVLYGLTSGLFCGGGLMLLYWSLSLGAMGISAAISGVLTATVPVVFSLFRYGHPSALKLIGFAVAGTGIWLVAYTPSLQPLPRGQRLRSRSASALAVGAGLSFGAMLIFMHRAAADGVLTALTSMRVASAAVALAGCAVVWLRRRGLVRWDVMPSPDTLKTADAPERFHRSAIPRLLWIAGLAGVLDLTGNFLYLVASRTGRLDVSAVLAAFYPAVTIALAVWLLRERASRSQWAGMGLALLAVLLITS